MQRNLPIYIPLQQAAIQYDVSVRLLRQHVKNGTIRAMQTPDKGVLVAQQDVELSAQLAHVKLDTELRGQPIRASIAARKYKVGQRNLSNWATAGLVQIVKQAPGHLILDEGDVKLATDIFHIAQRNTGSPVKAGHILKRTLLRKQSTRQAARI